MLYANQNKHDLLLEVIKQQQQRVYETMSADSETGSVACKIRQTYCINTNQSTPINSETPLCIYLWHILGERIRKTEVCLSTGTRARRVIAIHYANAPRGLKRNPNAPFCGHADAIISDHGRFKYKPKS